jgi:hypothetical protein
MGRYREAFDSSNNNLDAVVSSLTPPTPPPPADDLVSVTIKVPKSMRQHWQVEAKRRGTNVTLLVTQLLSQTLGTP